jgi:tRNA/tmRNA/rRNA uracil-C5-methylase (TrmA/RlmC/RlmD family)
MHKLLLALILSVTSVQASQVKSEGLRYPNMDAEFFDSLPQSKIDYYNLQLHKINRLAFPNRGCFRSIPKCLEEKRYALDKYRRANESFLQKNNNMAVKLLKESAPYLDISKVLLAYCYRYGIGTKCNKTASNILLDLVASRYEDKVEMVLHLEFLLTHIELGL